MADTEGLICAFAMDGKGRGTPRTWGDLNEPAPAGGFQWIHLDRGVERAATWLSGESGLDPVVAHALLAPETRPRCTRFDEGILVNLRGVNLNPGADPEDMVSVRIWVEENRILTVRLRRLMAVDDLRAAIANNQAPRAPIQLLTFLAARLAARMEPVMANLDDEVDELEAGRGIEDPVTGRAQLASLRRQASLLRRFIGPQRDALTQLTTEAFRWMTDRDRRALRETADDITRFVEALNLIWERAVVLNDELTNRVAEQTNQRLYLLSIITAIFLPLGFVTGLLGVNVGGIPATDSSLGFAAVVALLIVLGGLEAWLLRRLGWF